MRLLWHEHLDSGYTLEDFNQLVTRVAGEQLNDWLDLAIHSCDELDFESALQWFGLRFKTLAKDTADKTGDVWIGSDSAATEGRLWVRRVLRGSPSDLAGLNVDDELIALDGYRVDPVSWPDRLGMYRPGDELTLTVARRGKALTIANRVRGQADRHLATGSITHRRLCL